MAHLVHVPPVRPLANGVVLLESTIVGIQVACLTTVEDNAIELSLVGGVQDFRCLTSLHQWGVQVSEVVDEHQDSGVGPLSQLNLPGHILDGLGHL